MGKTVTIEIGDDRNRNILFAPSSASLRGRFSRFNMRPLTHGSNSIREMPDIPGLRIELDFEDGSARIYDPLETNKDLHKEVVRCASPLDKRKYDPVPERVWQLDSEGVKTWVWHMWRLCKSGKASLLPGNVFPPIKGKVKTNYFDWSEKGRKEVAVELKPDGILVGAA